MAGLGVHSAQSASPGAETSGVSAFWLKPPPPIDEMLSFSHVLPCPANWNP
jgi:hypothetical protein